MQIKIPLLDVFEIAKLEIAAQKFGRILKYRKRHSVRVAERNRRNYIEGKVKPPDWTGRRHTSESKQKISLTSLMN